MKSMPKAVAALAALAVSTSALAACSNPDTEASTDDTLTVGLSGEISNLDPHASFSGVNMLFVGNVFEGLLTLDGKTSELHPGLAESWESVDDKTYRLHLREGVTFQNGEPFNAEAVVYNLERIVDPKTNSEVANYFEPIKGAEAEDELTVLLHLKRPSPSILNNLALLGMVPPKAAAASPDAMSKHPVGTGPYVLEDYDSSEARLVPNEDYWGEAPPDRDVVLEARPEAASRVAGLETGELDIAFEVPQELVDRAPRVESAPTLETVILRLNGVSGITADDRVRQAIMMATDRAGNRDSLLGADFSDDPGCQFAPEGVEGHVDGLEDPLPYDPEAARALVREAGAEGKTIRLVGVRGLYPKAEEILQAMAAQIEDIGLKVDLKILEVQSYIDTIYANGADRPEAVIVGINSDQWTVLQPFASVVDPGRLTTFPHKKYPKVETTIDEARAELDATKREQLLQDASRMICDSHAFGWLYVYHQIYGSQDNVSWDLRRDNRILYSTVEVG